MSVAEKGYQMSNYGLKSYTPDQVKEMWRESVLRENKIASNHKSKKNVAGVNQVDFSHPHSYFNNDKKKDRMSAFDQTFHFPEGYCSKLKRDDSQYTQGLDVNGEEKRKKIPILSSSVYGHLQPLEMEQPTRSHVRVAVVRREFYRSCGTNLIPQT